MPNDNTNTSTSNAQQNCPSTLSGIIKAATKEILDDITSKGKPYPEPETIEAKILATINAMIRAENIFREKGDKLRAQTTIIPSTIADILIRLHNAVSIVEDINNPKYGYIATYCESGINEGIYVTNETIITGLINQYSYTITTKDIAEVMRLLSSRAPAVTKTIDENLVAVNNGIFDYDRKQLLPFDPKYIFTSKSRIDLVFSAINPVIHNPDDGTDWDVESWMNEIASDDPQVSELFWQILGAIIRPTVPWGKAVLLYSESGNNGKGTLCQLFRNIVGDGSWTSIPLSDMGKDFMLEPLIHASAIIVDENDVGTYIDKAANLKAIVTADTILINRKFQMPLSYRFRGLVVECLNEMPRVKDKSDSFMRRQLFVPFHKCFTGIEKKYIKNDYLNRPDVLRYVLKRVLVDMNYYEFTTPDICMDALETYKEYVDPIRQFAQDVIPEASWDLLPFVFLYDVYKSWFSKTNPTGSMQSQNSFIKDIKALIRSGDITGWELVGDGNGKIRPGKKMSKPEYLIADYDLKEWMNPHYKNSGTNDLDARCTLAVHQIRDSYRGLVRDTISGDE